MKALIRQATMRRPNSGEIQGIRLQAAVPNTAGRKMIPTDKGIIATKIEVPSFRNPYFILESMDYASESQVTDAEIERFKQRLLWQGFTEYEFLESKSDSKQPGSSLSPEVKAKIDALFQNPAEESPF